MKPARLLFALVLAVPLTAFAVQRMAVYEEFTQLG
jgi:hypothetical protein